MECNECNKKINIKKQDIIIICFNKYISLLNKYIDLYACNSCFLNQKVNYNTNDYEYLHYNKYNKSITIHYYNKEKNINTLTDNN